MKKKILGTVLLSAVVLSNVGGTTAVLAADPVAKGKGTVKVEQGKVDPPTKPDPTDPTDPGNPGDSKDPEKPDGGTVVPDIPGPHNPDPTDPGDGFEPGQNGGALAIIGTSNLRFGTVQTSLSDILQPASAARIFSPDPATGYNEDGTIKDGATYTTKSVGNYVQFGDVRTDVDGYQLTAKLEKEFTKNGGGTLKGATIIYKNGVLTHADAKAQGIHPTLVKPSMTLEYDEPGGAATEVVKLDVATTSAQKGKGIYSVEYGQSSSFNEDYAAAGTVAKGTEGNSIFLKIPATTAGTMAAGDYEAKITWTLTPSISPNVK